MEKKSKPNEKKTAPNGCCLVAVSVLKNRTEPNRSNQTSKTTSFCIICVKRKLWAIRLSHSLLRLLASFQLLMFSLHVLPSSSFLCSVFIFTINESANPPSQANCINFHSPMKSHTHIPKQIAQIRNSSSTCANWCKPMQLVCCRLLYHGWDSQDFLLHWYQSTKVQISHGLNFLKKGVRYLHLNQSNCQRVFQKKIIIFIVKITNNMHVETLLGMRE